MNKENIVEKWASCKHSLAFGLVAGDEAGYALREEGYNENYGCEHSQIVDSNQYPVTSFPEGGGITRAAVLHGIGKFDDPEVIEALKRACGSCVFYQKNPSKT